MIRLWNWIKRQWKKLCDLLCNRQAATPEPIPMPTPCTCHGAFMGPASRQNSNKQRKTRKPARATE